MNAERKFNRFDWQIPKMIVSVARGEDAEELYKTFNKDVEANYANNPNMKVLSYNPETKVLRGSNIFVVSKLNELLEFSNIRIAIPSDDRYGDISKLVKDDFYTDFNALILRTAGDSYQKNNKIAKDLAEKVENRKGKLNLPVMIVNPLVRNSQDPENSYKLVFDLSDKTRIIEDERLDGKKYKFEMKFTDVDDLGLPLFDKEGIRTWYLREDGLSGLYLDTDLSLGPDGGDLAFSSEIGRGVVVSDPIDSKLS